MEDTKHETMNNTPRLTIIRPAKHAFFSALRETWDYRDLLSTLGLRDLKVRYKQTAIGVAWAVIQPVLTTIVYSVTFGRVAGVPSDGIPYPIFSFSGLVFWTFFSSSLTNTANSLVANEGIVKKVFFPRLIMPLASTVVSWADFLCSLICLIALMGYYRITPSLLGILLLPALALWTTLCSLGLGLFLAALNVRYRDVRYALPFFTQLLVFVSPVIYPAAIFHNRAWILALNPMTGVIESVRYFLLGVGTVDMTVIATSIGMSLLLLFGGYTYFREVESSLADVL